jgi:hypothetical protein
MQMKSYEDSEVVCAHCDRRHSIQKSSYICSECGKYGCANSLEERNVTVIRNHVKFIETRYLPRKDVFCFKK